MADQSILKSAWNGGELSPLIDGRVDHAKYPQGMKLCRNGIPTVHGALVRRPGTKVALQLKRRLVEAARVRAPVMIPHEISADRAYLYVFDPDMPETFVVFKNREAHVFGSGYPLQTVPRRTDGSSKLSTVQSGEDLYIADDGTSPLKRIHNEYAGGTEIVSGRSVFDPSPEVNWVGSDATPTPFAQNYNTPPFQDYKPEKNAEVECTGDAQIGTIPGPPVFAFEVNGILWAPVGTFTGKNGHRIVFNPDYQEMPTVQKWSAGMTVSDRSIFYHQNRYYRALIATGLASLQTEPIHEIGAIFGAGGTNWRAQLGYIGNGHFSGAIVTPPMTDPGKPGKEYVAIRWDMIDAPKFKTARWAWAAVGTGASLETGAAYPDNVAIFRNRLAISAGNRLYFSRAGKLEDFNQYNGSGLVTADSAITIEIPSRQQLAVEWLVSMDSLIIGGRTGIFECREDTKSEVFGPGNVSIRQISSYGSNSVEPVVLDSEILYVIRGGKRLHRLANDGNTWTSIDLSVLADHLGASGIVEMAWQNEPWKVIWMVTRDGRLIGMTWNREQDVWGWHAHESTGGKFRGVACLPSPNGEIDDVWLATNRNFEGVETAEESAAIFVERFTDAHQIGGDLRDAIYTDCSVSFSGDAVASDPISGGLMLSGGSTWDENDTISLSPLSGPLPFTASDEGKVIRALDSTFIDGGIAPIPGGAFCDFVIEGPPSAGSIPVHPMGPVPIVLQGRFLAWQLRVDRVRVEWMASRELSICVDGCAHPNVVADGGGWIQLDKHHNRIHVGFPCKFAAQTMRIEGGATNGTSQSKTKRITHVAVRLLESVGIKIGPDATKTQPQSFRSDSAEMDQQVPAYSGDLKIAFPSGYTTDGYVYIENDQALPVTVVSMVVDVKTE